ncbi:hypothetical protein COT75_01030 [Candidatus Beckwithbacteria bacterium CG10_big_fil_rev_8_21_14_0_10_34_10]|uniref:GIY-YIG domain-containing protein n=1 Tax=Candidatus Beckwithbacteria bacterium CG10_big_fil_rev_8_21_14_0_10_34_10 TaxID=1974495 RepID=A0A2H0WC86_9BACT|nr:MAG: hypothetical protein COT75_01030 [Candidatus Beckwithbacteria bacterium CG10_big_fil_rev_8_21_14_0_10_34_10]
MWDLEVFMKLQWSKVYHLSSNNVNKHVPASPGVYRISVEKEDNKLRVIYVGQTKDLRDRLNQYVNKDTDNDPLLNYLRGTCYFRVAEVTYTHERDGVERALYEYFKPSPECNDPNRIPDVKPENINFE